MFVSVRIGSAVYDLALTKPRPKVSVGPAVYDLALTKPTPKVSVGPRATLPCLRLAHP